MCGIVASISNSAVAKDLINGLKRLEYRGYDSAGVSLILDNKTSVVDKHVGKVINLANSLKSQEHICERAKLGMAHTRWATHGRPSVVNAHPQVSQGISVVHNGIIENYAVIKAMLKEKDYEFVSETDTEVIAHFLHYIQSLDPSMTLGEVVCLALSQLRGAFGLCILDEKNPDIMVGARRGSPLILGVGDSTLMLASDATALAGRMKHVVYLMEDDVAICTRDGGKYNYEILNLRTEHMVDSKISETISQVSILRKMNPARKVERELKELTVKLEILEKDGYEHFMLKEIFEQPSVLKNCMRGRISAEQPNIKMSGVECLKDNFLNARRLIICACGTSYHSGLIGEYLIESLVKIPVEVEYASEFRYRNPVLFEDDVVIVLSQSGETADTLECVRIAKKHNCKIFGIVNVVGSSIARNTDAGIYLHIGPEIGVASTKAFTGQVTALILLSLDLALRKKTITKEAFEDFKKEFLSVPDKIAEIIKKMTVQVEGTKNTIEALAGQFRYAQNFLYLGRGYNFPGALEGALKLKEISYIHAEGYPAAEMKHGPIALIDVLMPVVIIAPKNESIYEKVCSAVEEVRARRGTVIIITTEGNSDFDDKCEFILKIPSTREELSPLLVAIPLQLLAYYIAKLRGCEIDQPRNLAKSVTVE